MKRLFIFLAVLAMATGARAADPTTELLNAPLVNDSITLSVGTEEGKSLIRYALDDGTVPKAADGLTFRSKGQIGIFVKDFNPLTQVWVVGAKATPDVSYAAIKAFLEDLKGLQAAFSGDGAAPPSGGAGITPQSVDSEDKDCKDLRSLIKKTDAALQKTHLDAESLQRISENATGLQGVKDADRSLEDVQDDIKKSNDEVRGLLEEIGTEYQRVGGASSFRCTEISSEAVEELLKRGGAADKIIKAKERLSSQIGDFRESLKPFLIASEWSAGDQRDFRVRSVTPTFTNQQEVSASRKQRTVTLADGSLTVTTDDEHEVTGKFVVRKHSFFVPERAVAVIYNTLTYPEYGTETTGSGDSEMTVVKRIDDHEPIDGAMMLNLVTRVGGGSVAYPFFQLGVSSAKDFPGLLAGIGMRFVEPFNFSLSVGGMITRYKDLDDKLKVGDPVSGTAEIKDHLVYKNSDVRLYGAIQVKF